MSQGVLQKNLSEKFKFELLELIFKTVMEEKQK